VAGLVRTLRSFAPGLPRSVWVLEAGTLVNFFGSGIAFPFLLIYLHNVRGFGVDTAGFVVSAMGVAGVAVGPLTGPIIDRVGSRKTLAGALVTSAFGYALVPLVTEPWQGFLCAGAIGVGTGTFWPSISVLLTALAPSEKRHAAFAVQRVALNLGIGLGGLVGGLVATTADPTSFTVLFLVDAASFLAMVAVLPFVREPPRPPAEALHGGYRMVVRDRALINLLGLNVLFITVGYATFELLPVFAKNEASVSEWWIGLIFFAETLTLVLAQLPVAKLVEGRRRMRALAVMPATFAVCWLVVLAGGVFMSGTGAALVFVGAAVLFGLGTCFHGPTQAALVADLAPARLRGRYMALSSTSWEVGFVFGPGLGGLLLAVAPLTLWPAAGAVCAVSVAWTLSIERLLPPALIRTPG
jgi:MFS family permease